MHGKFFKNNFGEIIMNEDIIKGKWHEVKGQLKNKWGQLTDDEIDQMNGSTEELQGILQKKYGYDREIVKKQIDEFVKENKWK
jgi:uncharacterized protein YjbJ (UPF0337 family)